LGISKPRPSYCIKFFAAIAKHFTTEKFGLAQ